MEYAEEPVVATGSVDAFVAADITLDGSLTEPAWRLTNELGGGQDFDILWDGSNLYFAAEAEEADTELVVTVGEETLATIEKTGDAFEARTAFNTKGITTIENVTLTVGDSVWTGDVNLVQMVRKEAPAYSGMTCGTSYGHNGVSASADGRGIVFDMPALTAANGAMNTLHAFKTSTVTLAERTGSVALEFTLDPEAMPALDTNAVIGRTYSIRSGLEVVMSDGAGNAIRFGIGYYEGELFMNCAINLSLVDRVSLGKDLDDGAFEIKLVWNMDGSLDVYVDGVLLKSIANAAATDAQMEGSGFAANNMLHLRATRYDYNVELGLWDQPQKFTVSNIRLSSACEVEEPAVATGTVDALVASDITRDGSLTEPAWRLTNELGGGQDFDILWDGTNLYFAVEAQAGDSQLVVTVGDETLLTAEKTGNDFEARAAFDTKGVTTIEDVTLQVGSSVWTGDVNLVQMVRKDAGSCSSMTNYGTNYSHNGVSDTADGRGIVFDMPALTAANGNMNTLHAMKNPTVTLTERTGPVALEFTFDPEAMPELDTNAVIGKVYSIRSGFELLLVDAQGTAVRIGIGLYEGELFLNCVINSTLIDRVSLGKALDDGAFDMKLVWNLDGSLDVYVDGVLLKNIPNATATDAQMDGSGWSVHNMLHMRSTRYDYNVELGLWDQPQKFTVSDLRLSSACEVEYVKEAYDALLSETAISVDGELDELAWLNWKNFSNPAGNIAAAWSRGNLYFAAYGGEADSLLLSVNEVPVTVDLVSGTLSGIEGAVIAQNAKTGVYEIGIPLTALSINLTDYNQSVPFKAQLVDGDVTAELNAELLVFTGTVAELQSLSSYTKDNGPWTLLNESIVYNGEEPGKVNYVFKTNCDLDHGQLIVISKSFRFDRLPITEGKMITATQSDGFYYYFTDEDPNTRYGTTTAAAIFTEDGENLKIRISQGQGKEGYVFDLNRTLGEEFRVTHYWYPDGSLDLYVDGVLLGTATNIDLSTYRYGIDNISYRYYSETASAAKVKFTIFNQNRIVHKYDTVLDELTQSAVFGRIDLDHVQKDLPMVTTFASANFEALNLKWTSSDTSVVETDGTIHRHATEAKSAVVTVYFVDGDGNEIELWSVTVTVDPMSVTKQAAPAIIHTGFAAPGSITIDGVVETDENWLFNGWALNEEEQSIVYFGTQWDEEKLYIVLDTEMDEVSLFVGDCPVFIDKNYPENDDGFTMAVSGSVVEIAMDHSYYSDVEQITDYGAEIEFFCGSDFDNCYEGTLKLTNVDWWATDNIYAALPMLANNVKSVSFGTADAPDENQGAKQLENGWRLYDLYGGEDASNPAGIRTYVLFMKMPIYENFGDRSEATHVEFDFYAKALPEWEWDEEMKDAAGIGFANYGVTFSLSDKADSGKNSNVSVFGIVNTTDGLMMVVNRGTEDFEAYPLNKQVGEEFRLGLTWQTNGDLVLTVDGEAFITIPGVTKWVNQVGDSSFVINMLRNKTKPTGEADDMDVYMTNIAFGKAHSLENIIRNLTFEDFAGQNEAQDEILYDLELPAYMTNGQLSYQYPITWTSSDEATVDPETGKVTRPATGVRFVTLTAELDNYGVIETKSFDLIIMGLGVAESSVLVLAEDVNPFTGVGYEYDGLLFNLDKTNNSVIYTFNEATAVNLVTLTDLDAFSRLNRGSLRLFYSNDNTNYTEIEDYKLHHDGCNWYLYDFEVEACYIKVHFSNCDYEATDFFNVPGEMIHASYDESLIVPADAVEIEVPYTWLLDQAVAITLPADLSTENLRIALNGELLFHYVEKDGTVYIRIADPTEGVLQIWNAGEIELADKENVYEVTYGTRETRTTGGEWVLSVKAGTTFPDGSSVEVDTLFNMHGKTVSISTDGGYTWKSWGSIDFPNTLQSGGWGIDSKTGRLFHENYYSQNSFNSTDITKSGCTTYVFYSDNGGKTWQMAEGLGQVEGDLQSIHVLSYTDITELAGNDGEGPNVDFVFPMGAQFNNNGAFCGRVAYTVDGGLTWHYSESKITYGNETAFEGGVSEATILEREDGTLVYYARCQSSGVDNFTISYSLDHGVTWLTPGATSSVYTTNTQALMMTYDFGGFDGNRLTGTPMFMWGGNNVLGGNSYMRMPLNFAISTNGMDTFRDIQNIFFGTFQDVYTTEADHYITNPSIQQIHGDNLYLRYYRLIHKDSIFMVVNDFTDWFLRTKGAYDSFEKTSPLGEGWRYTRGSVESTDALASEGSYSMLVRENTQTTRSVPYIQNGTVELDVYADASSNYVIELQPAYSNIVQKCAAISVQVTSTTMTLTNGTEITLAEGWNHVVFNLNLQKDSASISVNGTTIDVPVDTDAGDYVTYLTVLTTSNAYIDELLIIETEDVVIEATNADKAAADQLIETIKGLEAGDTEAIAAAKAAYDAMPQIQQDLVNRRVPTGTSTNANDEGALINYYEVLMALYNGIEETDPIEIAGTTMTLGNDLSLNFMIDPADIAGEGLYAEIVHGNKVVIIEQYEWTNAGDYIRISYKGLAAKEMVDDVTVTVCDAAGNIVSVPKTDSIRAYAMRLFGTSEAFDTVLADMLIYGAAAQLQFNYKTNDLADKLMSDEQRACATAEIELANIRQTADGYKGTTLGLESNIVLNFFYDASYVGKTATVSYTNHYGVAHNYDVVVAASGSMGKVSVSDLVISDCSVAITVTIDGVSVVDSVESYCARMTSLALGEPLMKFAASAKAYFANTK